MPETLYAGKFLRFLRENRWEYVARAGDAAPVGIIALTHDRALLLVEQHRIPLGSPCIELPAGLVGDTTGGESVQTAAIRELEEETGYTASSVELLNVGPSSAGLTSEQVVLVRAVGVKKIATRPQGQFGDGTEGITLHEVPLDQIPAFLAARRAAGTPIDHKIYAALYFLLSAR